MEQLSKTMQYKDINVQQIFSAMNAAKWFLERQRNTNAFSTSVVGEAQDLTEEPKLPRQKQILNDGAPNHHFHIPEDYFRQQYFEFIDLLSAELSKRFSQPTFCVLWEIEEMIIGSCNGYTHDLSSNFEICIVIL